MFQDASIVATAVSSFNNAALFAPYFFVIGLLNIPVFFMTVVYGRDILARLKCDARTCESKLGFWAGLCLAFWLLCFCGNYAVIRDGISLLPVLIAFVLFGLSIFITNQSLKLKYLEKIEKHRWYILGIILLLAVCSALPNLYGIILQVSAIICGIIVGSRIVKNVPTFSWTTFMFLFVTVLILMQPEYFRFGQLGNLTMLHLGAVLLTGFFAITALVARYTKAKGGIYQSAYIKIKWLFRILSLLALILFVLTESVPVFLGLLGLTGLSEMLTIFHSKQTLETLSKQSWAMVLMCFGIIIICPVISCLGVLYLADLNRVIKAKDFIRLL